MLRAPHCCRTASSELSDRFIRLGPCLATASPFSIFQLLRSRCSITASGSLCCTSPVSERRKHERVLFLRPNDAQAPEHNENTSAALPKNIQRYFEGTYKGTTREHTTVL